MHSRKSNSLTRALKLSASALAAAVAIAVPVAGNAADTATLTVSANVNAQCQFESTGYVMNFGTVDPLTGIATPTPVSVGIRCNRGAVAVLSADSGGSLTPGQRRMVGTASGDELAYDLRAAGGADFDNCGTAVTTTLTAGVDVSSLWSATGGPETVTLCGTIPANQSAARQDSYTDSVLLTITY